MAVRIRDTVAGGHDRRSRVSQVGQSNRNTSEHCLVVSNRNPEGSVRQVEDKRGNIRSVRLERLVNHHGYVCLGRQEIIMLRKEGKDVREARTYSATAEIGRDPFGNSHRCHERRVMWCLIPDLGRELTCCRKLQRGMLCVVLQVEKKKVVGNGEKFRKQHHVPTF